MVPCWMIDRVCVFCGQLLTLMNHFPQASDGGSNVKCGAPFLALLAALAQERPGPVDETVARYGMAWYQRPPRETQHFIVVLWPSSILRFFS